MYGQTTILFLTSTLPKIPKITIRRPPTLKNIIAPSKVKKQQKKSIPIDGKEQPGSYKCGKTHCKCCQEIADKIQIFSSQSTRETFKMKYHLT